MSKMLPNPAGAGAGNSGPGLVALYLCFQNTALHAFGGVLPWARRDLVERRGWLTADEFTELLGLCQFLPGPNISNLSIAVGSHFRGVRGALAAFLGLYTLPMVIAIGLVNLYQRYGRLPRAEGMLDGIAAVAAGLILAMALKIAAPLFKARRARGLLLALATFGAIGVFRLPLLWVLPTLAVLAIVVTGEGQ